MEDIGGITILEYTQKKRLSITEFLKLAIRIVSILGEVHSMNVIHKDITPYNIIINPSTKEIKLIDFGISSIFSKEHPTVYTVLEGTLLYISPEQTGRMNRFVDHHTDFYSLGCTFYHILTGSPPFTGSLMDIIHAHLVRIPESLFERSQVPKAVSDIIMKLMSKEAEDRYHTARGLNYDLNICLERLSSGADLIPFKLGAYDKTQKFVIPQKLYGRDKEISVLMNSFEKAIKHGKVLVLVSGYSGIGKTSLVNEVLKPITRERGYFVSGKFDQMNQCRPYASISYAFKSLMLKLLREPKEELVLWKKKMNAALGSNSQVIINIIPEVECILGPPEPILDLGPEGNFDRFRTLFCNFINVFATRDHPLTIFFDDLQWVDAATLRLLEILLTTHEVSYLLVITAYRNNEVDATHIVSRFFERMRSTMPSDGVDEIVLDQLSEKHINEIICDTLNSEREECQSLSDLVRDKTGGNPFFIRQFLRTLYDENFIRLNKDGKWEWSVEEIKEQDITDNVVHLMISRITLLSVETQTALMLASCVGINFDIRTLSYIMDKSPKDVFELLLPAIEKEFVVHLSTHTAIDISLDEQSSLVVMNFKFLHDRVQQAAYELIENTKRNSVHCTIGRAMLTHLTSEQVQENIFPIVDHLNKGKSFINSDFVHLKETIDKLNLDAGKKAKNSMAYERAIEYFNVAMENVDESSWETRYDFVMDLFTSMASALFLSGKFNKSAQLIYTVVSKAKTSVEKVSVLLMLIVQNTLQGRYTDAIETGYAALKLINIELPNEESLEEARQNELDQFLVRLNGQSVLCIDQLPKTEKKEKELALSVMTAMGPPSYRSHQLLWSVINLKAINFILQNGTTPSSAYIYTSVGALLGYISNDWVSTQNFIEITLRLFDKFHSPTDKSVAYLMIGSSLRPWSRHLKVAEEDFNKAYSSGMESGNLQYAAYSFAHQGYCCFYQGQNTRSLKFMLRESQLFSIKKRNKWANDLLTGILLIVTNLINNVPNSFGYSLNEICRYHQSESTFSSSHGKQNTEISDDKSTKCSCSDADQKIKEETFLHVCEQNKSYQVLCIYYILKMQVYYLYGSLEDAMISFENATKLILTISPQSLFPVAAYNFYHSLITIARLRKLLNGKHNASEYLSPTSQRKLEKSQSLKPSLKSSFSVPELPMKTPSALKSKNLFEDGQEIITRNQKQMQIWSKHCPQNFEAMYYLVEAEMCDLKGEMLQAQNLFDKVIEISVREGFVHLEALANELCGKMWIRLSNTKVARIYLGDSLYCYRIWGAETKANMLEKDFPLLAQKSSQIRNQSNSNNQGSDSDSLPSETLPVSDVFDIHAVLQATRAISTEIMLEGLMNKLMSIMIKTAGAELGFLILNIGELLTDRRFVINARGNVNEISIISAPYPLTSDCKELDFHLVQYVIRTKMDVVLSDARTDAVFGDSEYVMKNQPKSILCLPILNGGEITAVVYFENNQISHAFTPKNVEILKLLASQASISINNAKLYTKYHNLHNNAIEGIYQCTPEGVFISANPSLARILGCGIHELSKGKRPIKKYADKKCEEEFKLRLLNEGEVVGFETELVRPDGTVIWVSDSARAVRDIKGSILFYEGSLLDLTQSKEKELAERQRHSAELANREKSKFLRNMSHEFRTPMHIITGMTSLLLRKNERLSDEQKEYLEGIRSASDSLLMLVNDILDLSQIEAGKLKMDERPFDFYSTIDSIYQLFKFQSNSKSLQCKLEIGGNIPKYLIGDDLRIRQVIINLAGNAIKFTSKGSITLRFNLVEQTQTNVIIKSEVIDTGPGIPDVQLDNLFKVFSQLEDTTHRQHGGSGLGLAISKHLVKLMGGEIGVKSQVGVGSTFWFTMCLRPDPNPPTLDAQSPRLKRKTIEVDKEKKREDSNSGFEYIARSHNGSDVNEDDVEDQFEDILWKPEYYSQIKVLLVDDNKVGRVVSEKTLTMLGIPHESASNGQEAIDFLKKDVFDLVLMDIHMPVMDGLKATEIIRNPNSDVLNHHIPVVAMTAGTMEEDKVISRQVGMNGHLSKPFRPDHLSSLIQTVILDEMKRKKKNQTNVTLVDVKRNHKGEKEDV
eukprot:TRINITY_DN2070_c0_g3_i1.p1 TRINITY_DN2070_c0_g3~~TRINITY_DN2070_c0_g3_i1.p1  ORF type:complete len:2083 (-),score=253.85 TRINITY_DN2070_c0_g3_i1:129-6377(-)